MVHEDHICSCDKLLIECIGIGATTEIRQMEARRRVNDPDGEPTRILALTGMSSLEDKRKAFEAGVDG